MRGNQHSYKTSYLLSIIDMRLGSTILKIQFFASIFVLDVTFQGHSRSKIVRGNESSHMTSYMLVLVGIWLVSTVLKIQVFENIVTLI